MRLNLSQKNMFFVEIRKIYFLIFLIFMKKKYHEIILPNAFTPNGDGINETIRPVSNCMTKIKMSIYDTWGSLIYVEVAENQDIYGWDGTIDGNPAENGNYIMVVEATTFNGAVIDLNGPVTLIK